MVTVLQTFRFLNNFQKNTEHLVQWLVFLDAKSRHCFMRMCLDRKWKKMVIDCPVHDETAESAHDDCCCASMWAGSIDESLIKIAGRCDASDHRRELVSPRNPTRLVEIFDPSLILSYSTDTVFNDADEDDDDGAVERKKIITFYQRTKIINCRNTYDPIESSHSSPILNPMMMESSNTSPTLVTLNWVESSNSSPTLRSLFDTTNVAKMCTPLELYTLIELSRKVTWGDFSNCVPEYYRPSDRNASVALVNKMTAMNDLYEAITNFHIKPNLFMSDTNLMACFRLPVVDDGDESQLLRTDLDQMCKDYSVQPAYRGVRLCVCKTENFYVFNRHGVRVKLYDDRIKSALLSMHASSVIKSFCCEVIIIGWDKLRGQYEPYQFGARTVLRGGFQQQRKDDDDEDASTQRIGKRRCFNSQPDPGSVKILIADVFILNGKSLVKYHYDKRMYMARMYGFENLVETINDAEDFHDRWSRVDSARNLYYNGIVIRDRGTEEEGGLCQKMIRIKFERQFYKILNVEGYEHPLVLSEREPRVDLRSLMSARTILIPVELQPHVETELNAVCYRAEGSRLYFAINNGECNYVHMMMVDVKIQYSPLEIPITESFATKIIVSNRPYNWCVCVLGFEENSPPFRNLRSIVPRFDLSLLDCPCYRQLKRLLGKGKRAPSN